MKKLSCLEYSSDNSKPNRLIFQQESPKEQHPAPETHGKEGTDNEWTRKIVGSGIAYCSESACKLERFEEQWKKDTNLMLGKIQEAPQSDKMAFNTVLKELAAYHGKKIEPGTSVVDNFYNAMQIIGVPDTEMGHGTFWNDILFQAKQDMNATGVSQKYEFLKSVVDSVRNSKKTAMN